MARTGTGGTGLEGNTKSSIPRLRKGIITLNNYTDDELARMVQYFSSAKGRMIIIGKEIGEECGTPHLQIYYESTTKNPIRFEAIKKEFPRIHIKAAKGTREHNIIYCSKEEVFLNTFPPPVESRKDRVLRREYGDEVKWNPFQQLVLDIVQEEPCKRSIYWFYDLKGNIGKSYLCKYLMLTRRIIIGEGKKNDVFHQLHERLMETETEDPEIILVDIPRDGENYVSYGALEKLKNGALYSGKYEGGVCVYEIPHVIIFANFFPHKEMMSDDRWQIYQIDDRCIPCKL